MKNFATTCLTLVGLAAISACSDKEQNTASGGGARAGFSGNYTSNQFVGSYEYEVNGCKTGKHEYTSKAELCQMLKDDSLNNGCASVPRAAEYDRACVVKTAPRAVSLPTQAANNPRASNTEEVLIRGTFPVSHPTQSIRIPFPDELTLFGKFDSQLSVKTSQTSGSVLSTLDGSFEIQNDNGISDQLLLTLAQEAIFAEMPENCTLSVRNFTPIRSGQPHVRFTLIGIDSPNQVRAWANCATALEKYARSGFQVKFIGAYLVSQVAGSGQTTVHLTVY